MRNIGAILCAALAAAAFGAKAHAETCKPLTLLTSIDLVPVDDKSAPIIPVTINGTDQIMLVDTGGFVGTISPAIVDKLDIPHRHIPLAIVGVSGDPANELATTETFRMGRIVAKHLEFMVDNRPMGKLGERELAGTISPNVLKNYDIELDMDAGKFNILSQDHCQGHVIYWPATTAVAVPIDLDRDGHIIVPVTLNGKTLQGLLDTGSAGSVLVQDDAESYFGLKMGAPGTPADGTIPGTQSPKYKHQFQTLSFQGVTVTDPEFEIMPDLMRHHVEQGPELGTHIKRDDRKPGIGDVIVGMNVLRHLHLYIAYGERMLYVTPAGAPVASAAPAKATATSSAAP